MAVNEEQETLPVATDEALQRIRTRVHKDTMAIESLLEDHLQSGVLPAASNSVAKLQDGLKHSVALLRDVERALRLLKSPGPVSDSDASLFQRLGFRARPAAPSRLAVPNPSLLSPIGAGSGSRPLPSPTSPKEFDEVLRRLHETTLRSRSQASSRATSPRSASGGSTARGVQPGTLRGIRASPFPNAPPRPDLHVRPHSSITDPAPFAPGYVPRVPTNPSMFPFSNGTAEPSHGNHDTAANASTGSGSGSANGIGNGDAATSPSSTSSPPLATSRSQRSSGVPGLSGHAQTASSSSAAMTPEAKPSTAALARRPFLTMLHGEGSSSSATVVPRRALDAASGTSAFNSQGSTGFSTSSKAVSVAVSQGIASAANNASWASSASAPSLSTAPLAAWSVVDSDPPFRVASSLVSSRRAHEYSFLSQQSERSRRDIQRSSPLRRRRRIRQKPFTHPLVQRLVVEMAAWRRRALDASATVTRLTGRLDETEAQLRDAETMRDQYRQYAEAARISHENAQRTAAQSLNRLIRAQAGSDEEHARAAATAESFRGRVVKLEEENAQLRAQVAELQSQLQRESQSAHALQTSAKRYGRKALYTQEEVELLMQEARMHRKQMQLLQNEARVTHKLLDHAVRQHPLDDGDYDELENSIEQIYGPLTPERIQRGAGGKRQQQQQQPQRASTTSNPVRRRSARHSEAGAAAAATPCSKPWH